MKTLVIVRHAKSDWSQNVSDHERSLNPRGLSSAPDMGQRLAKRFEEAGIKADQLISSSAVRARTTAELFAESLRTPPPPIRIEPNLYASSPATWLQIIQALPDDKHCVLIFGHNPEISSVVSKLVGSYQEMATCTVAQLQFDIEHWEDITGTTASHIIMDYPKRPYQP